MPPTVTSEQPTLVRLLPGSNFTFSCQYTGLPSPIVVWEHNSAAISVGGGVGIVTGANSSKLTVIEGTEERGGVYRCKATNSIGTSSVEFTVLSKSIHIPWKVAAIDSYL